MQTDFHKRLYQDVKQLFPDGAVQVFVARTEGPKSGNESLNPQVKLVHVATGITAECEDYPSQTENYIAAAIRLKISCDLRKT